MPGWKGGVGILSFRCLKDAWPTIKLFDLEFLKIFYFTGVVESM